MALTRPLAALACVAACALGAGCASSPDADACSGIVDIGCDGGFVDDASGAWVSGPWAGPHPAYPGLTTVRVCHGLGRAPNSVEVYAAFSPTGNLAQQIGNVATVLPACGAEPGVTARHVLLRNGQAQDFYARFVFRP
ncbi:MAG: hypothetical protein JNK72_13305 [Myxococcales bacterium]|nr:hypothetical protein [Myxococcales bacterium]